MALQQEKKGKNQYNNLVKWLSLHNGAGTLMGSMSFIDPMCDLETAVSDWSFAFQITACIRGVMKTHC